MVLETEDQRYKKTIKNLQNAQVKVLDVMYRNSTANWK
jgi:hypothetical protein